jgi:MFS family permease
VTGLGPLLRHREFRAIWAAAVVSGLGDRIATIALYLAIYNLTDSAVNLGLLAATQILPAVVLGPATGLLLDRHNRKGLMVVSDGLSVLVAATLALAHTPFEVYVLATMLACGRQLTGPARLALIPDVVPESLLASANALLMVTRNLVLLVGPALGGAMVAWRGSDAAFLADAATFLASAVILVAQPFAARQAAVMSTPPTPATGVAARFRVLLADSRAGLAGVTDNPRLRFAFLFFAALTFVTAMQQPLVVVFVKGVLHGSDVSLGLVVSAAGLGGILGAVLGGARAGNRRPLATVVVLTAIDGALLLVFAATRHVAVAAVLFAAFGAIGTLAQIALATFLQRETPEDARGRTFGWLGTCVGPLSLVSVFLGPLAAGAIGAVAVLALSGAFELMVAVAGAAALRARGRRGPGLALPPDPT